MDLKKYCRADEKNNSGIRKMNVAHVFALLLYLNDI